MRFHPRPRKVELSEDKLVVRRPAPPIVVQPRYPKGPQRILHDNCDIVVVAIHELPLGAQNTLRLHDRSLVGHNVRVQNGREIASRKHDIRRIVVNKHRRVAIGRRKDEEKGQGEERSDKR